MSRTANRYSTAYSGNTAAEPKWQEPNIEPENPEPVSDAEPKQKRGVIDLPFLVLTLIILLIGVVMVLSASFARAYYLHGNPLRFFTRQFIFAVAGIGILFVVTRLSVNFMKQFSFWLLIGSVALLAAVLVFGTTVNGARRWIDLGFTTFQPSEIAKLAVIMSYSAMICQFDKKMKTFKYGIFPFVMISGIIIAFLMFQPHVSAAIIIVAQTAIMMFAGGARLRWFVVPILIASLVTGYFISSIQPGEDGQPARQMEGRLRHVQRRITSWQNPELDPQGAGFQARQSLYAVGSGGLFGQGLGQSRQKHLFLPEEHNDFIFAIVAEELGFIGSMMILSLFALLIIRGFWLALHAKDRFGSLVITGITALLAIQVFLNVAVVTNLIPATGISLPFFSYGGTALWIQLIKVGIILAISRDIPLTKAG